MEERSAHNRKVAGSSPASATSSIGWMVFMVGIKNLICQMCKDWVPALECSKGKSYKDCEREFSKRKGTMRKDVVLNLSDSRPGLDLRGKMFNNWTVVDWAGRDKHFIPYWLCKCSCGREFPVRHNKLVNGEAKGCRVCGRSKSGKKYQGGRDLLKLKSNLAKYRKSENWIIARREGNLRRKYGIGLSEYKRLFDKQDGKCLCCYECGGDITNAQDSRRVLVVDHDHGTKKVRGLLCRDCNLAIGIVDENVTTLRRIIDYLTDVDVETMSMPDTISDGFGSTWSSWCPECGKKTMQVVRPGSVQCGNCG